MELEFFAIYCGYHSFRSRIATLHALYKASRSKRHWFKTQKLIVCAETVYPWSNKGVPLEGGGVASPFTVNYSQDCLDYVNFGKQTNNFFIKLTKSIQSPHKNKIVMTTRNYEPWENNLFSTCKVTQCQMVKRTTVKTHAD